MKREKGNRAVLRIFGQVLIVFCLFIFVFHSNVFAQNTKGDRPSSNQEPSKDSKARLKVQKKIRKANSRALKRIPGGPSSNRANNAYPVPNAYSGRKLNSSEKPAKPLGPVFNTRPDESRSRAWKGDFAGRKIKKETETQRNARAKTNIYPQPTKYKRYLAKKARKKEKPWEGDIQGKPIIEQYSTESQNSSNVYPQGGFLPGAPRGKSKTTGNYEAYSESGKIKNVYQQGSFNPPLPKTKGRRFGNYQAFSESGKIKNVFQQQTFSTKPKIKKAPLNTASGEAPIQMYPRESERFQKPQDAFGSPNSLSRSYVVRKRKNVYWGKYRKVEKPFLRDIAGLLLRRKNYSSQLPPLTSQDGALNKRSKSKGKTNLNFDSGLPSANKQDNAWIGDVSGKRIRWKKFRNIEVLGINPNGIAGSLTRKEFIRNSGLRAGGVISISGSKGAGQPLPPNSKIGIGSDFRGGIKTRRPLKGGGSISGNIWNNENKSITDKLKKGGASISGRLWNNHEESLKRLRAYRPQGFDFSGTIKAKKPKVGGKSISGKLWNNNEESLKRLRVYRPQGFDFSGTIKAKKPKVGGKSISGHTWNNNEKHLAGTYARNPRISVATSGQINQKEYILNPKANILSNKKLRPRSSALAINGIKSKIKQGNYQHKPKAVELALLGLGPNKNTVKASSFNGKLKLKREYVHNPKSAVLALKVLSQPKAYAAIADFRGKSKTRKASLKNNHPDARFAHIKENNVKGERTFFTTIKLKWAKLFKKNELQPKAAKQGEHPLRYDRQEKDLWKALYDYNDVKK